MVTATDPRVHRRPIITRTVGLAGALVVLVLVMLGWDLYQKRPTCIACSDGQHCRMDMRDFVTRFSAYSVELETTVGRRKDFSSKLKLDPVQLQQLSDSLQNANEFRKYLVAGYNSCAITAANYERDGRQFQAMDSVAREINNLASTAYGESAASAHLTALISQFDHLAKQLGGS